MDADATAVAVVADDIVVPLIVSLLTVVFAFAL
jgi:hypothetical protein